MKAKTTIVAAVLFLCLFCAPAYAQREAQTIEVSGSGLHLPAHGVATPAPGGAGRILVYGYRMPKRRLAQELFGLLKLHKWKISRLRRSPRGSVRLTVEKRTKRFHLSVAGRGYRSAIILTFARKRATYRAPVHHKVRRRTSISVPRFRGLQLPSGGFSRGPAPGGRGRLIVYSYRRSKQLLLRQVLRLLAKTRWKILRFSETERGSIRILIQKNAIYRLSIAGSRLHSGIILTR